MLHGRRLSLFVAVAIMAAAVGSAAGDTPLKVLFIGNSFTNQNDLPTIFGNLVMDAGWQPATVVNASVVGQTLQYHTTNAATLAQIDAGGWDCVILQEYSTRPTDSPNDANANPAQFKADATWLYDRVKLTSPTAKVVLYATWARQETNSYYPTYSPDRDTMQAQLNFHYHDAAENYIPAHSTAAVKTDVLVAPVGEAWHLNYHGDNVMLHATDKYHPNQAGSYLAGLVIYGTIYGRSGQGRTPQLGLTPGQCDYLQGIADATTGVTAPGGPAGQRGYGVFMGDFETPALPNDSDFLNRKVSGWTQNSPSTNGLSVRNSANDLFANTSKVGGVDRDLPAPANGRQFLWINSGEVIQQLRDVLLPKTKYTLTVAVGRILKTSYVDTNYYIKLYAGDQVIQTLTGDTASLPLGEFTDHVITFHTDDQVAPGQPLRIFLGRTGTQVSARLAFDNVRLSVKMDGDFSGDGAVTQGDYTIWADTFGFDGSPGKEDMRADGNGDGHITHGDYTIWADNYARTIDAPLTVAQASLPAASDAPLQPGSATDAGQGDAPAIAAAICSQAATKENAPGTATERRARLIAARKELRAMRAAARQFRKANK